MLSVRLTAGAARIEDEAGPIDILVNNTGLAVAADVEPVAAGPAMALAG
jgi:NAD(P)-dependent dehydrogenase (short-subunit alcohol dehydrogenase family)